MEEVDADADAEAEYDKEGWVHNEPGLIGSRFRGFLKSQGLSLGPEPIVTRKANRELRESNDEHIGIIDAVKEEKRELEEENERLPGDVATSSRSIEK
jgi:hypothetical protein